MDEGRKYRDMLTALGVSGSLLTSEQRASLGREGYVIVPDFIEDQWLEELRVAFDWRIEVEGKRAGSEFKPEEGAARLANCVNKGEVFLRAVFTPWVLSVGAHVIGRPFKIHGFNARDALPGQGHQDLHADHPRSGNLINALWLLDDFAPDNGATRVVPGSHRKTNLVRDELVDPKAPHPGEVVVKAQRGSVLVIDGHLWHGGTRNVSGRRRRVLHISYVARELPQQVEQRANISRDTYAQLSWAEKYLLDVEGAYPELDGGSPGAQGKGVDWERVEGSCEQV